MKYIVLASSHPSRVVLRSLLTREGYRPRDEFDTSEKEARRRRRTRRRRRINADPQP